VVRVPSLLPVSFPKVLRVVSLVCSKIVWTLGWELVVEHGRLSNSSSIVVTAAAKEN
jgi:hypothetical protein